MTLASSHNRMGRGASGKAGLTASSSLYSRGMSWAVGATGPKGGRRRTNSSPPKRIM
jgi:hypothetical protein